MAVAVALFALAGVGRTQTDDAPVPDLASNAAALADRAEARLQAATLRGDGIAALADRIEALLVLLGDSQSSNDVLRERVGLLSTDLDKATAAGREAVRESAAAREQLAALTAELAAESAAKLALKGDRDAHSERLRTAESELEERGKRITSLVAALTLAEKKIREQDDESLARGRQASLAAEELELLRRRLGETTLSLKAAEARAAERQRELDRLAAEQKQAKADDDTELARYRSEFFARLGKALGERPDVRVVGDRFVFQSEVLFESGSARLGPAGQYQLVKLAETLRALSARFPRDLPWVLRIDGHTDTKPISTAKFPSNWELSTARAISVVRFLMRRGVPAKRLVAAGFAAHQPLDPRTDEIGNRRNRRIEIKLTQP